MEAGIFIVLAVIAIALSLALRWLALWYFRINEAIDLLRQIRDRLPDPYGFKFETKSAPHRFENAMDKASTWNPNIIKNP